MSDAGRRSWKTGLLFGCAMNKMEFNIHFLQELVRARSQRSQSVEIKVNGLSMYPLLQNEDKVIIFYQSEYEIGDILVYGYCRDLLVHRLLRVEEEFFYLKGDNAFQAERINKAAVIGKVIKIKKQTGILMDPEEKKLIIAQKSLEVHQEFLKRKSIKDTMESVCYKEFSNLLGELVHSE